MFENESLVIKFCLHVDIPSYPILRITLGYELFFRLVSLRLVICQMVGKLLIGDYSQCNDVPSHLNMFRGY